MILPLKLNNNNDIYYNRCRVFSYPFFFALIFGGRGIGKTTTFLVGDFESYGKTGEQFMYVRRYKSELKTFMKESTIPDILEGVTYKAMGKVGYVCYYAGNVIGYLVALSMADDLKSSSFPKVTMIVNDECILRKGSNKHYIKDEPMALLELASTVFRTRTNGHIVCLGNNLDMFNPYSSFFNIPSFEGDVWFDKKRHLYVEYAHDSPKLRELEKKTPLYQLVDGTQYGNYHYNNEVMSMARHRTMPKPSKCDLYFRIAINNTTLNVYNAYIDNKDWLYIERREREINDDITYEYMKDNQFNYYDIAQMRLRFLTWVSKMYYNGCIGYSDDKASDLFDVIMTNI